MKTEPTPELRREIRSRLTAELAPIEKRKQGRREDAALRLAAAAKIPIDLAMQSVIQREDRALRARIVREQAAERAAR